jgi:hypothetical protein
LVKGDLPYLGVLFKKSRDYEQAARAVNRAKAEGRRVIANYRFTCLLVYELG